MADPFTKAEIKAGETAHAESLADAKAHANSAALGRVAETDTEKARRVAEEAVLKAENIAKDEANKATVIALENEAKAKEAAKRVAAAKAEADSKKESVALLVEIQKLLKANGDTEAGMPYTSKYWDLSNQYRQLIREGR